MATRRKRSEHYVNNKEFLAALEVYIAQVLRAKLNDADPPQIPRYIGECFLKIANHLLCIFKKDITREKTVRNQK